METSGGHRSARLRSDGVVRVAVSAFRVSTPSTADNSPQTAHAFYCLWEDRAFAPTAGAAKLPQMGGSQSTWTRQERLQAVVEGRRHLGQQVLELVLMAPHRIETTAAEREFGELLPAVVKLPRAK